MIGTHISFTCSFVINVYILSISPQVSTQIVFLASNVLFCTFSNSLILYAECYLQMNLNYP